MYVCTMFCAFFLPPSGNTTVFYNGRSVAIESMHGGIEPSIIAAKLAHADIAGRVSELRKAYQGRYVFVGIDKVNKPDLT